MSGMIPTTERHVVYPTRALFFHHEALVTNGNGLTRFVTASQQFASFVYQNASADADSFTHSFLLKHGTYTFVRLAFTSPNSGIIDWTLDGTSILSGDDYYSAGNTANVRKSTGSISVVGDGRHKLTGTVNGQNASSGGYDIAITYFAFLPSSDVRELG